jgi:alkylation response protein AidB-like acyl-CoA dehydrogenase
MLDFFNIDSLLSEDERAVRDSVRRFVDERVLPIIGSCYVDGRFPKEILPDLAELGVFGANLPEEYGCAGLNNVAYGLIMQELERGDSGVRSLHRCRAHWPCIRSMPSESEERRIPASNGERARSSVVSDDFGSNHRA